MANHRMFSYRIINSSKFLQMPHESQNLYFHLGIRADDDGVAEAYPVMRLLGSNNDNLQLLVAKGFIRVLNDDLVIFITDWLEHNKIRADRKTNSMYKDLLEEHGIELIEQKPRADTGKITGGQPMDVQRTAQVKLSKVKLSKDNNRPKDEFEVIEYLKEIGIKKPEENGRKLFYHYESKGWIIGKSPVKNWKACCRNPVWGFEKIPDQSLEKKIVKEELSPEQRKRNLDKIKEVREGLKIKGILPA